MKKVLIVSTLGLFLAGCLTNGGGGMSAQQATGSLLGAAAGGLMGSKFGKGNGRLAATAVGTALGAVAGNMITQPHDCNAVARQDQGYGPQYHPEYYQPHPGYYQPQPQYYPQPQPRRQPRSNGHRRPVAHQHYHQPAYPADYWY